MADFEDELLPSKTMRKRSRIKACFVFMDSGIILDLFFKTANINKFSSTNWKSSPHTVCNVLD